ncbi:proline-rich protein 15-like protein isoform X1 [Patagioenas fasciata]|uniref:proline-rich protein 15-like protein isoform X1 n=2 Tax=Patagioenas fasciata TaxID=372321 RepID=UPI003A995FD9
MADPAPPGGAAAFAPGSPAPNIPPAKFGVLLSWAPHSLTVPAGLSPDVPCPPALVGPRDPPSRSVTPGWSQGAVAMAESHGWWKLTFLRKRRSVPTVLYESPDSHGAGDNAEGTGEGGPPGYTARLEKIVDKSTKGKHVKVSNSGRFKEKKKVRATLAEHPNLCGADEQEDE